LLRAGGVWGSGRQQRSSGHLWQAAALHSMATLTRWP
jgi:hypothetical protein